MHHLTNILKNDLCVVLRPDNTSVICIVQLMFVVVRKRTINNHQEVNFECDHECNVEKLLFTFRVSKGYDLMHQST